MLIFCEEHNCRRSGVCNVEISMVYFIIIWRSKILPKKHDESINHMKYRKELMLGKCRKFVLQAQEKKLTIERKFYEELLSL